VTPRVSSLGVFLDRMATTGRRPARRQAKARIAAGADLGRPGLLLPQREGLYNRIFGALGLIIGVIVVFVVTNAMAMAVIERTREIGTLRALGTLPGQLVRSFALEGLLLGGVGTALGAALALAVTVALLVLSGADAAAAGRSVGYPLQIAIDPLYG
jgi:putative ABC transport system permease protein